jgi:hypothetical protein
VACKKAGAINKLGTPAYQAFEAYGYYAECHLDRDFAPSMSTVEARDADVSASLELISYDL